ncbi:glucokinase [Hyphomonas sp. WL0036]|uniref:glucokinase n=1 Tax=Hyphomonas sediminis TaxID=2866160 RepID=UPI001C7F38CE|nr:glucokinase [Hyphomonas sediminis]
MVEGAILVGDVGGTNTRFAVAHRVGGAILIEQFEKLPDREYASLEDALEDYLARSGVRMRAACIALAGPVRNQEVTVTNRGWHVSAQALKARFGFADACLINDFHAMARSVPELAEDVFEEILPGQAQEGAPILVTGPGTGLGVATLFALSPGGWKVLSGEGGHMAYAPRTATEHELARLLARDHGYVSNELVASGSGLDAVHAAFCEMFGRPVEDLTPAEMQSRAAAGDEMYRALIESRALAVMGAAGDLVLANGALGGVVLAGGVSERISDYLRSPLACERFVSRGPMSAYLETCPVRLMRDATAPLKGAAAYYEQLTRI